MSDVRQRTEHDETPRVPSLRTRNRACVAIAIVAVCTASVARADVGAFADHSRLALTSSEFLGIEGARMQEPRSFRLQIAFRQLGVAGTGGAPIESSRRATTSSVLEVGGWVAPTRYLTVGASLPLLLSQRLDPGGMAIGDLRIAARLQGFERGGFGGALVLGASVPTGSTEHHFGEGSVVAEPSLVTEWRGERARVVLSAGARFRTAEQIDAHIPSRELAFALGLGVRPVPAVDLFGELHADVDLQAPLGSRSPVLEALAGIGLRINDFEGRAAGGVVLDDGLGAPRLRIVVTLAYAPRAKRSPVTPTPRVPAIPAAPTSVAPEERLIDWDDAEDVEESVDEEDERDEDDEVGQVGEATALPVRVAGPVVAGGAPRRWLRLAAPIFFKKDSARIRRRYQKRLRRLSELLAAQPPSTTLVIEGHADGSGPARWNRKLSQERARRVERFLEEHGVDAVRLRSKGVGAGHPRSSNHGELGRSINRRVEVMSVSPAAPSRPVRVGIGLEKRSGRSSRSDGRHHGRSSERHGAGGRPPSR